VLSAERPRGRLFSIGSDWVYRRRYVPVEEELEVISAVTRDDVTAVLAKYPPTRNLTLTIGPLEHVAAPE
jgi:predicted Zn-dependent peptidase